MRKNNKPLPRTVLIFGAAGHIGRPLARFLTKEAPEIKLRLASSRAEALASLRKEFQDAECVLANYYDQISLEAAVDGMEGMYVACTVPTDERKAMGNLIAAIKSSHCATHILRAVGMQPEANLKRIPEAIREPVVAHNIAKALLDESDLPVTYLNYGATFMNNFLKLMAVHLRSERKLVWHNRKIPFIDSADIAEVAGRLLLSDNHRHLYQFHTLNNGQDHHRYSDVAEIMTDVWQEKITFDGSKEAFLQAYEQIVGLPAAEFMWRYFDYEEENEVVWALNDFTENILGRKPKCLRSWLLENRNSLLG